MISEIDDALRSLIRAEVLDGGSDVSIAFDCPDSEWSSQQNSPAFNLYLYDVSENLVRREVAYEPVRDETGRVTERRPPPRRFDLSYLVSAWTQRVEDEHRLMDEMLICLLSHEYLPREHLEEELAAQPLPVRMVAGRPRPESRRATEVWNALGGTLKPSIDLVVTTPFTTRRATVAGPPVLEAPRFEFVDGDAAEDGTIREHVVGRPSRAAIRPAAASDREPDAEEVVHGGPPGAGRGGGGEPGPGKGKGKGRPGRTKGGADDDEGADDESQVSSPPGRRFVVQNLPRR